MIKILCIIDLRDNTHYSLERAPAIKRALKNHDVSYICIYEFVKLFGAIQSANEVNFLFSNYVLSSGIERIFTSSELFEFLSVDTFHYLTQHGVVISCVLGDDENNYDININYLGIATIPIAYQKKQFEKYRLTNPDTYHLPISVSFEDTNRYLTVRKEIDVLFIGRPYANRLSLLRFLHKSGVKINIYGSSEWSKYFDGSVYKGFVDNNIYYQTVAKARVYLAFLESPQHTELLHINAKPFDAAKVGTSLIISKYKTFSDDYNLLEGVDFLSYSTKLDLLQAINKLLSDEPLRNSIASSLRSKLSTYFNYDSLYISLFNNLINHKISQPRVKKANILFLDKFTNEIDQKYSCYDFVIFRKSMGIEYCIAISDLLSAYVNLNQFIKLDSTYRGSVARKRFGLIDMSSLVIPVSRMNEIKPIFGFFYVKNAKQTYIPCNSYKKLNFYILFLVAIRKVYLKFK